MLRFLWCEHPFSLNPEPVVYRFDLLDFRLRPFPLILGATVEHHLRLFEQSEPEIAKLLKDSLYVQSKCSKGILIASVYRPFDSSKHLNRDFNELFDGMLTKAMSELKETVLLGDMNANFLDNKKDKDLKSIFNLHGLKQMIRQPTRIAENIESLIVSF